MRKNKVLILSITLAILINLASVAFVLISSNLAISTICIIGYFVSMIYIILFIISNYFMVDKKNYHTVVVTKDFNLDDLTVEEAKLLWNKIYNKKDPDWFQKVRIRIK